MLHGLLPADGHPGPRLRARRAQSGPQCFGARLGMPVQAESNLGAFLVVEDCQAHPVLADAANRHEAALLEPVTDQPVPVADERHGPGHAAHPQRHDQPSAVPELLDPGERNVHDLHGDDDAVVRRVRGDAVFGVARHHGDVPVAGGFHEPLGPSGDIRVDVHGDDPALFADHLREVRSVRATGADFQDSHPGLDVGLLDLHGLNSGADTELMSTPFSSVLVMVAVSTR